jgi:hypothetical protein
VTVALVKEVAQIQRRTFTRVSAPEHRPPRGARPSTQPSLSSTSNPHPTAGENGDKTCPVTEDGIKQLREIWDALRIVTPLLWSGSYVYLKRAIESYLASAGREEVETRFMDCWIGLDALFDTGRRDRQTFYRRVAVAVGNREEVEKDLRLLHEWRGSVAHGKVDDGVRDKLGEACTRLRYYLWGGIVNLLLGLRDISREGGDVSKAVKTPNQADRRTSCRRSSRVSVHPTSCNR